MAAGLLDSRFDGRITLIGAEPEPPYERPHLSKGYLLGIVARNRLALRSATQYRDVVLLLGNRVTEVDVEGRSLRLESGRLISWDVLCIATGSDARRLPGLEGAVCLRELPEADVLRGILGGGGHLDIVGAGFIGCEVAAAAVQTGCTVHVYETLSQPLARVLGPEVGAYIAGVHRARGVDLTLNVASLPAMKAPVLVGVGSVPRTELAERAGLKVDSGIVVDELGRTSASNVFAAGDVTRFYSPHYETHIRVEHFQTAQRQGYAVGRAMAGATEPYREVPWFWSAQYDTNVQYAGAGLPWDETAVRGEIGKPPFSVFYLAAGRLIAAAGVNDHHTVARARHLMEARRTVTRAQLEDSSFDLRRVLA